MKRTFLACMMTVALLGFAACKSGEDKKDEENKHYAEQMVGDYDVVYSGTVTVNVPTEGERSVNIPQRNTTATLSLDGDDGHVKMVMDRVTTTGYVDKEGLHLNSQNANDLLSSIGLPSEFSFLQGLQADITIKYTTAPLLSKSATSWNGNFSGNVSYSIVTVPVNGTLNYTATKK